MRRISIRFPPARHFCRLSLALAGLLCCCFGTWSVARAGLARLLSVYGSAASQLATIDEALRWSPADSSVHHARARVLADTGQDEDALREFERAVKLCPADYYLWLELGHAREETEDLDGAGAAFREAVRLAPAYAQPHWQLGNFMLRAGEIDEAFGEMRRAVASDATLFPAMFDLAWGAYENNPQTVWQATQPQTDTARLALARFFAAHRESDAAINLFRAVSSNAGTEERHALISELLAAEKFSAAHEVWLAGVSNDSDDGSILFDGGFEREIKADEQGFGWQPFRGAQTVHFGLDAGEPHAGARSLRLEYGGNFAPATPAVSQLVLVKSHTRYRLSFAARTQELVTAGLPLVAVRDAVGEHSVLAQSDPLARGTGAWQDYQLEFETKGDMRALLLSIQRQKCASSPCPIFGRAWFDSFRLAEL